MKTFFTENYKGVCIEIGAYDGISGSNTYHFEKLGWDCLCIEPNTVAYNACKKVRSKTYQCCISDSDKEDAVFHIYHLHDNQSAISSLVPDERLVDSHKHLITQTRTESVKVRGLTSLLTELDFPTKIDFISIDTENTELDVLKGIDFAKYDISYLIIENNFNEPFCEDYLKTYGYRKIHRLAVNDFYSKI